MAVSIAMSMIESMTAVVLTAQPAR